MTRGTLTAIESGVEIKKTTNLEHDNGFAFGPPHLTSMAGTSPAMTGEAV
jgi:hypothetical protein